MSETRSMPNLMPFCGLVQTLRGPLAISQGFRAMVEETGPWHAPATIANGYCVMQVFVAWYTPFPLVLSVLNT